MSYISDKDAHRMAGGMSPTTALKIQLRPELAEKAAACRLATDEEFAAMNGGLTVAALGRMLDGDTAGSGSGAEKKPTRTAAEIIGGALTG